MSIEEIKERVRVGITEYMHPDDKAEIHRVDCKFLLDQNQLLVGKLDEARKEWREMFSKSTDVLMALYTLNLCCPDPETMEFEWEDGKEDYIDALNKARSLL